MKYLIWSNEHGAWWRAAKLGYTTVIADAGRYDEQEARTICDDANRYLPAGAQPNEVMVPAPEALSDLQGKAERLCGCGQAHYCESEVALLRQQLAEEEAARGRAEAAGRFMARKLDEQRAPLATAQRGRIEQLEAQLAKIDRLAGCSSTQAFLALSDGDKARWFSTTGQRDRWARERIKVLEAALSYVAEDDPANSYEWQQIAQAALTQPQESDHE